MGNLRYFNSCPGNPGHFRTHAADVHLARSSGNQKNINMFVLKAFKAHVSRIQLYTKIMQSNYWFY